MSMQQNLQKLADAAAKLNAASSEQIGRIEADIAKTEVGDLTVWLRHRIETVQANGSSGHSQEWHELGYAEHQGKWCIVVRRFPNRLAGEYPSCDPGGEVIPLLDAPQHVKLASLHYLDELVERLAERALRLTP